MSGRGLLVAGPLSLAARAREEERNSVRAAWERRCVLLLGKNLSSSAPNLSQPFFQTRSAVSKLWILLFWEPHAWSLASRAVWNLEACALRRAPQLSPTLTVRMTFLKRHTRRLSNHPFLKCSSLFETSAKPSPHKINCNSFNQIWARHCVVLPQGLCTHSFTPACSFPIQRSGQMSLPQRAFSWPPYRK